MEEVFVKMGESIYPIHISLTTNTFLDVCHEIMNIFCGYDLESLIQHFTATYPDLNETISSRSISIGHIFEIPMKYNIIYR